MHEMILEKIIKDYKNGDSLKKLKTKYDYSIGNLYYHLNKRSLMRKNNIIKFLKNNDQLSIGILIGIWMGDGSKFKDKWSYVIKIHLDKRDTLLINFIKNILLIVFGKTCRVVLEEESNRGIMIMNSKFIYDFIDKYTAYKENKTLTIKLKRNINQYNNDFIRGVMVGLTLSDGYIKDRFVFNTISKRLASNVYNIFKKYSYNPAISHQPRKKYGWYDLQRVSLNKKETLLFRSVINDILTKYGSSYTIDSLKRYA